MERCDNSGCPFWVDGICNAAQIVNQESIYQGQSKLWESMTKYSGLSAEDSRLQQANNILNKHQKILSNCGTEYDTLKNALEEFKKSARI